MKNKQTFCEWDGVIHISTDALIQLLTQHQGFRIEIKIIPKNGETYGYQMKRYQIERRGDYLEIYQDAKGELYRLVLNLFDSLKRIDAYTMDMHYIQMIFQDRILELAIPRRKAKHIL